MLGIKQTANYVDLSLFAQSNSYDVELNKQYYKNYFETNKLHVLLNQNITISKILENDLQPIEIYDEMCSKNPLCLFNECFANNCVLKRDSPYGIFRRFMETKLINNVRLTHGGSKNINYTSVEPGGWFQDIIILSRIGKFIDKITFICIGQISEFANLIIKEDNNPNIVDDKLNFDINDENIEKCNWAKLMVFKIIKLLEWFKSLNIIIELRLYKSENNLIEECQQYPENLADVFVGIDYFDQFPEYVIKFIIMSQCCTKNKLGIIASLRTDGIPFLSNNINHHLEICYNDNQTENIDKKLDYVKKFGLIHDTLKSHTILRTRAESDFSDDTKDIVENGIVYKYQSTSCNSNGMWDTYTSSEYANVEKQLDAIENKYVGDFIKGFDKLKHIYNLHGTYKSLAKMSFYLMFYKN
jgi:hypothetical protein